MGTRHETGADPSPDGLDTRAGWWPSPWSASTVAAGKVARTGLQATGGSVYWTESRPAEGGRQVVVQAGPGGDRRDVSPPGVSVRSRVHEYGGSAATVWRDTLFYVDQDTQQWYRVPVGDAEARRPVLLTPGQPATAADCRYADGRVTGSGRWLLSVVEEHTGGGETRHRLEAVGVDGSGRVVVLFDDTDFVAAPRPSPDGRFVAWIGWDHPSMPWDSSVLLLASVEESAQGIAFARIRTVSGGGGSSVGQPRWCYDGSLVYADDRTGWWQPYRLDPRASRGQDPVRLSGLEAEFHAPDWILGQSTMAELGDGSLVCRARSGGRDRLVRFIPHGRPDRGPWRDEVLDQPCVSLAGVTAQQGRDGADTVYVLGSTPAEAGVVFELRPHDPLRDRPRLRRLSAEPAATTAAGDVSAGRAFSAQSPVGRVPGLFFPPANTGVAQETTGRRPPLVVFCHGGPTSSAEPGFDPVVQFLTSRGLAVGAVDYRGSSGYGRAYRQRLLGRWGEADVEDCVQFASALARAGFVDGSRMAIRGTSAGGLTALGALCSSRCFAGAASWYGVTDLEALAADTHDFESRYVDSLVGPWPEAADTYRDRSPIHHPDRMSGRVLLLQGSDDPVVPADQAARFAARLEAHGVPCRLVVFDGEAHGFRRAETIEAALSAELDFYRDLFAGETSAVRAAGRAGDDGGGATEGR
jgi:dipeptidyl aminopeptidase/acylaminoacyl peptidase